MTKKKKTTSSSRRKAGTNAQQKKNTRPPATRKKKTRSKAAQATKGKPKSNAKTQERQTTVATPPPDADEHWRETEASKLSLEIKALDKKITEADARRSKITKELKSLREERTNLSESLRRLWDPDEQTLFDLSRDEKPNDAKDTRPLSILAFPNRTANALSDAKIHTVEDLRAHIARAPLTKITGIGDKAAATITEALANLKPAKEPAAAAQSIEPKGGAVGEKPAKDELLTVDERILVYIETGTISVPEGWEYVDTFHAGAMLAGADFGPHATEVCQVLEQWGIRTCGDLIAECEAGTPIVGLQSKVRGSKFGIGLQDARHIADAIARMIGVPEFYFDK